MTKECYLNATFLLVKCYLLSKIIVIIIKRVYYKKGVVMGDYKILLLEDDQVLSESLVDVLESSGFVVDLANDGEEAIDLSYDNSYDLYIFDINVPKVDGFELLSDLRGAGDETPAIYITALTDIDSITKGFNAGADDYLKKPFLPQELLVRVEAKLKKTTKESITYNDIEYHPATKEVYKSGKLVSLGSVQIKIFDSLMQNIGKITPKELLMDMLENPSDTALRVSITKLKQKLELDITNIRGIGYTLEKV